MAELEGSIQLRGKTAAQWAADTTPPLDRQPCVETDTGQMKIGDGVNVYSDLDYVGSGTSGVDSVNGQTGVVVLTTADIADSNDKRYVTQAEKTVIGNTSGTNTGDQTSVTGNSGTATALQNSRNIDGQAFNGTANITVIAPGTHAATSKATPVDADEIPLVDSAASNVLKRLTWANLKATLANLFAAIASPTFTGTPLTPTAAVGTNTTQIASTAFVLANRNTSLLRFAAEASQNPTDGATAFFGTIETVGYTNTPAIRQVPFVTSGVIKSFIIWIRVAGTLGSNETLVLNLRIDDTTDNLISTGTIKMDAVSQTYLFTGLNITITAGHFGEAKFTFPTWGTNPTNVLFDAFALVEPA